MPSILSAYGLDPGPTQRPLAAGLISGALATLPATLVLAASGALRAEAAILGLSLGATLGIGCAIMAAAGGAYGRLFGRGANDGRGGWLFGMAYGFLLWMAGAVLVLPLISGGEAPAGTAAIGIYVSLVLWGTALGGIFPHVHRRLHVDISDPEMRSRSKLGSEAASADTGGSSPPRRRLSKRMMS
jgi:hypothetical protein